MNWSQKATYYKRILTNPSLVKITVIDKDYDINDAAINTKEWGVQYKQVIIWLLYSEYKTLR